MMDAADLERLFSSYMKLCDVPRLEFEETPVDAFRGKTLGIVNGSAWIQLWSYYFGRKHLPGVKLVNIGNDAIQLSFMKAHASGEPCPPESNIELFIGYTRQLIELPRVDAVIITCSTMNRSLPRVLEGIRGSGIPVIQIDKPMMKAAVSAGRNILIVATHGPTVGSTRDLLEETAAESGITGLKYSGITVEDAFDRLGKGDIKGHNGSIANAILRAREKTRFDAVVLAQLSMSVFDFDHKDCVREFGAPVFNSGDEGFKEIGRILKGIGQK
jgi:hypothetical protein